MHIIHPLYRDTGYRISDNSNLGLFRYGFERACAAWQSGCTAESLTHEAQSGSPEDRGVIAACDMILGWHDIAEREARAWGMSRDEAERFVAEMNAKLKAA